MNHKVGAIILAIGVFFLLLFNVGWGQISGLVKAYTILATGLVCIAAFLTAQGPKNELSEIGSEVAFQVAGAIAAAVIVGTIFTSMGGPFWNVFIEDHGKEASRNFKLESQVLTEDASSLSIDIASLDLEILAWDNPEISANGTIKVFASSVDSAEGYLNETTIKMLRDYKGGIPNFRIEVDGPGTNLIGVRRYILLLTVFVPSRTKMDLDVKSASGQLKIVGTSIGVGSLRTFSGDVTLKEVTGDSINISITSGSVEGSLTFADANIRTLSGSMDVDIGAKTGTYLLKSTSGSIKAKVPAGEDVGLSIQGETLSGNVYFDVDGVAFSIDKRGRKEAETTDYALKKIRIAIKADTMSGVVEVTSAAS